MVPANPTPPGRAPRARPWLAAGIALAVAGHGAAPARAQDDGHRLRLPDDFREAGVGLYVSAGVMTGGAVAADLFYRPDAPWTGWSTPREDRLAGIFEDDPVRRRRHRIAARLVGFAASLQTELVDPALVVWAGDRNRDVAKELYAMNGLSLAVTALVTSLLTPTVRRPRPSYERCLVDPEYDPTCGEADQVRSFIDGRLAITVTSTALTCTHHANLPIYGARPADRAACAGSVLLASTSALLAILADRQRPTDVIAAVALGVLAGFVLPSVVSYRSFD